MSRAKATPTSRILSELPPRSLVRHGQSFLHCLPSLARTPFCFPVRRFSPAFYLRAVYLYLSRAPLVSPPLLRRANIVKLSRLYYYTALHFYLSPFLLFLASHLPRPPLLVPIYELSNIFTIPAPFYRLAFVFMSHRCRDAVESCNFTADRVTSIFLRHLLVTSSLLSLLLSLFFIVRFIVAFL